MLHGLLFDPDKTGIMFFQNTAKINSVTFENTASFIITTV